MNNQAIQLWGKTENPQEPWEKHKNSTQKGLMASVLPTKPQHHPQGYISDLLWSYFYLI